MLGSSYFIMFFKEELNQLMFAKGLPNKVLGSSYFIMFFFRDELNQLMVAKGLPKKVLGSGHDEV